MWISEFARQAGVPVDTVRFYVRKGLLQPSTALNGYQAFSAADLRRMDSLRIGQALGLSLQELKALVDQGAAQPRGAVALAALRDVRQRLQARARELAAMDAFVGAKIDWLEGPMGQDRPVLADFLSRAGGDVPPAR